MSVAARYARELAKMYDEQAAEIDRLKREQNNMIRFEHCQGCGSVLQPEHPEFGKGQHTVAVADEDGDPSPAPCGPTVLHEYGQVNCVALEIEKRKLADELATLRASLAALVTAGKASNFQTPDTVGEYRYVLVSDSTDLSEDDGYCYSRDLEGIMNRPEAERQLSSRRPEERPELYALVPLKQFDALSAAVRQAKGENQDG